MKLENLKDTAEGGTDCPMQEAWNECEEKYRPIKVGSPIDRLVLEAMVYALEQFKGREAPVLESSDAIVTLWEGVEDS